MRFTQSLPAELQALCEAAGFTGATFGEAFDWMQENGCELYILNDWHNPPCKWDYRYWLYQKCDPRFCSGIVLRKSEYNIPTWEQAAERAIRAFLRA